jgi:type VI secretion system protein ImpG
VESFAFLAARVQLKMDSRFPDFTQNLLQIIYPQYQAQKPSCMVVQMSPDPAESGLAEGYLVPRHSTIKSRVGPKDKTSCQFRTAHDLNLWPVELTDANYFSSDSQLEADGWSGYCGEAKAGIKLSLKATAGLAFNDIKLDDLNVFITGPDELPITIYEQIFSLGSGFLIRAKGNKSKAPRYSGFDKIKPVGFNDEEALLPVPGRQFRGYRLLQEYFSFPSRFQFFELTGLQEFLSACVSTELEILILLDKTKPNLAKLIDKDNFRLHSTPAINLIERSADRITIKPATHEYEVVVDKTQPQNYEVYSVESARGYTTANEEEVEFLPCYGSYDHEHDNREGAFYATRQSPRLLSSKQKLKGTRTSYIGSKTFISLVDRGAAPVNPDIKQVAMKVLCTNRDLPLQMPLGRGGTDFTLDLGAPVEEIRCIKGPTKPKESTPMSESNWRLISLLSLNMESLVAGGEQSASALRELCRLLSDDVDPSIERQIESIKELEVKPVVRQFPHSGHITFGRGLEVKVTCDENGFQGLGVFLFGAVLERFISRYASMNTFTELVLSTQQRNEIYRWPARVGNSHLL